MSRSNRPGLAYIPIYPLDEPVGSRRGPSAILLHEGGAPLLLFSLFLSRSLSPLSLSLFFLSSLFSSLPFLCLLSLSSNVSASFTLPPFSPASFVFVPSFFFPPLRSVPIIQRVLRFNFFPFSGPRRLPRDNQDTHHRHSKRQKKKKKIERKSNL